MTRLLDGKLPRNSYELGTMARHFMARDEVTGRLNFDWSKFLEELYDMDTDSEGSWDKSQWYCLDCILMLMRLRLRKWWIMTKIRSTCMAFCHIDMPINRPVISS
jgi:hypothetical protein